MEPPIKLPLPSEQLADAVIQSKDCAVSHGLVFRTVKDPTSPDTVMCGPHSLLPAPIPRRCFENLARLQKTINLLFFRISQDYEFVKEALKNAAVSDEFTSRLLKILETVLQEGVVDAGTLALLRSDYMLDSTTEFMQPKQIEINTIASSLGAITSKLTPVHRYMMQWLGGKPMENALPENNLIEEYSKAFVQAWELYGSPTAAIVFVVSSTERNVYDQRLLEYGIKKINPSIPVKRETLRKIGLFGKLTEDRQLLINDLEVAIIYYRDGYVPTQFTTELEWDAVTVAARSRAICCPNISLHLAGTKKIQQQLFEPGVVERFVSNQAEAKAVRETFVAQYSLDIGPEGDKNIAIALETPDIFVMKPNKEGGGNNIYGDDIRTKLLQIYESPERNSYILMERILPFVIQGYRVTDSHPFPKLVKTISEYGMFGALVSKKDEVLLNEYAGHLVRTKGSGDDEGGVAVGNSVLDTPYLF